MVDVVYCDVRKLLSRFLFWKGKDHDQKPKNINRRRDRRDRASDHGLQKHNPNRTDRLQKLPGNRTDVGSRFENRGNVTTYLERFDI